MFLPLHCMDHFNSATSISDFTIQKIGETIFLLFRKCDPLSSIKSEAGNKFLLLLFYKYLEHLINSVFVFWK